MNSEKFESKISKKREEYPEKVFGRGEFNFEIGGTSILNIIINRDQEKPNELTVEEFSVQDQSGETKSLLEYLPAGWKFILYETGQLDASADFLDKIIKLPSTYNIESSRNISKGEELPKAELKKIETLFGETFYSRRVININKFRQINILERLPFFQQNPGAILSFLHEVGHAHHPNHKDLPEDFHERSRHFLLNQKYGLERVPEERDAWAFAIKTIRDLEKEGFDFGDAFSKAQFEKYIRYPLVSYEDPKTLEKIGRNRGNT